MKATEWLETQHIPLEAASFLAGASVAALVSPFYKLSIANHNYKLSDTPTFA